MPEQRISEIYDIAQQRVSARSQQRLWWNVNMAGFLIYIGLFVLLVQTPLIFPALFILMAWIAGFTLHTQMVEQGEAYQQAVIDEASRLRMTFQPQSDRLPAAPVSPTPENASRNSVPIEDPISLDSLSPRELEVMTLLATGASNGEIAAQLVIAPNTVKRHVKHILAKLQATNRTQAVHQARQRQLI